MSARSRCPVGPACHLCAPHRAIHTHVHTRSGDRTISLPLQPTLHCVDKLRRTRAGMTNNLGTITMLSLSIRQKLRHGGRETAVSIACESRGRQEGRQTGGQADRRAGRQAGRHTPSVPFSRPAAHIFAHGPTSRLLRQSREHPKRNQSPSVGKKKKIDTPCFRRACMGQNISKYTKLPPAQRA